MDSSKINFEKKAVLLIMVEWPVTDIHAGCMTEKTVDWNNKLDQKFLS